MHEIQIRFLAFRIRASCNMNILFSFDHIIWASIIDTASLLPLMLPNNAALWKTKISSYMISGSVPSATACYMSMGINFQYRSV